MDSSAFNRDYSNASGGSKDSQIAALQSDVMKNPPKNEAEMVARAKKYGVTKAEVLEFTSRQKSSDSEKPNLKDTVKDGATPPNATTTDKKDESIVDTVKNKANDIIVKIKTDKAYMGATVGLLTGIVVGHFVNEKKNYGLIGLLGIAAGCGAVGYGVGRFISKGGISGAFGGSGGSKADQIKSKITSLFDKALTLIPKLDKEAQKQATPSNIAMAKAMVESKMKDADNIIGKLSEKEKDMSIDILNSAGKAIDKLADIKGEIDPMMAFGLFATLQQDLSAKYSQAELDAFGQKLQTLIGK